MNTATPLRVLNTLNHQQNQIMVPIDAPLSLPLNLPSGPLIEGSKEEYLRIGVPLYEALIKGDWKAAKAILDEKPELVRFAITKNFDTPLRIAASAQSSKSVEDFVKNLVNRMERKDLELQNKSCNTAFSLAAAAGNFETTKIMVEMNKTVLEIRGSQGMMPLYVAALYARHNLVRYLYRIPNSMRDDYWTYENRGWVLQKCVEADIYDIAIEIVSDFPELTSNQRLLRDVLLVLAQKTYAFDQGTKPNINFRIIKTLNNKNLEHSGRKSYALQFLRIIWNKISIMPDNEIETIIQGPPLEIGEGQLKKTMYPSREVFVAAKKGNLRFIVELIHSYPDLVLTVNDKGQSIFHVAVEHRQANIYNLLYEIGSMKELITSIEDENGNNMLHLVAKIAKRTRLQMAPGVALHTEVWHMIPPAYRRKKNIDDKTPYDIFKEDHKELLAASERWMKETSPQCLVGATIIATMSFTTAFTAPGGYDQNTGIPMFVQKPSFLIFVIADTLSLVSSSALILMLLSMFTSRYDEHEFLEALPKKLMLSLATLYTSIVTMIVAFTATFFVLYQKNLKWVPTMVIVIAFLPILLFSTLQYEFLEQIFYSTYLSNSLFKPGNVRFTLIIIEMSISKMYFITYMHRYVYYI